jgi:hypothetical protein
LLHEATAGDAAADSQTQQRHLCAGCAATTTAARRDSCTCSDAQGACAGSRHWEQAGGCCGGIGGARAGTHTHTRRFENTQTETNTSAPSEQHRSATVRPLS